MRCGRYAAIDIGTVTCRMLVVDVGESGLHELTREYAITNLGEGVDATGELKLATRAMPPISRHACANGASSFPLSPGPARPRCRFRAPRSTFRVSVSWWSTWAAARLRSLWEWGALSLSALTLSTWGVAA